MNKFTSILKSHWPAIVAFGVAFWAQFGTGIMDWVKIHPRYSAWASLLTFIVGFYLKSPFSPVRVAWTPEEREAKLSVKVGDVPATKP